MNQNYLYYHNKDNFGSFQNSDYNMSRRVNSYRKYENNSYYEG